MHMMILRVRNTHRQLSFGRNVPKPLWKGSARGRCQTAGVLFASLSWRVLFARLLRNCYRWCFFA